MPNPYDTLGLPTDAPEEAIRAQYLALTRQFPPEQYPTQFAAIRAAYDVIKDLEGRTNYRMGQAGLHESLDTIIEELACRTPRRRIPLADLLSVVAPRQIQTRSS